MGNLQAHRLEGAIKSMLKSLKVSNVKRRIGQRVSCPVGYPDGVQHDRGRDMRNSSSRAPTSSATAHCAQCHGGSGRAGRLQLTVRDMRLSNSSVTQGSVEDLEASEIVINAPDSVVGARRTEDRKRIETIALVSDYVATPFCCNVDGSTGSTSTSMVPILQPSPTIWASFDASWGRLQARSRN